MRQGIEGGKLFLIINNILKRTIVQFATWAWPPLLRKQKTGPVPCHGFTQGSLDHCGQFQRKFQFQNTPCHIANLHCHLPVTI